MKQRLEKEGNLGQAKGKEKKKIHYPLYNRYTPLRKPADEVFLEVQHKGVIPPPPDMRASVKRKASLDYCKFHKARGHDTKDCFQLKNAIEDAVRRGYLKDFIDLDRCNPERPTQRRRRDDDQDDERPTTATLG